MPLPPTCERCVTFAVFNYAKYQGLNTTTIALKAFILQPPQMQTLITDSNGKSTSTYEPDAGWEYERHDVVGKADEVEVMVTWKREVQS
jgi:hypothetical protein